MELSAHSSPPGDHSPLVPPPPPPSVGQLGGGVEKVISSYSPQLGVGIIRNILAIPIGWLVIRSNLDWLPPFSSSAGFTVNFPNWVIWAIDIVFGS